MRSIGWVVRWQKDRMLWAEGTVCGSLKQGEALFTRRNEGRSQWKENKRMLKKQAWEWGRDQVRMGLVVQIKRGKASERKYTKKTFRFALLSDWFSYTLEKNLQDERK